MNRHGIVIIALACLFAACSTTKYVQEDELLYNGTKITFTDSKKIKHKKQLASDLETFARPKKNSKLGLWFYNIFHNPDKEKGIGNWISGKLGDPPVLFQVSDAQRSQALMENYLHDNGYFGSVVTYDTLIQKKKVKISYNVTSEGQYQVRQVYFPEDTTPVTKFIQENIRKSKLKAGQPYRLADIQAERARLARIANNAGFFRFNEDFIYFFVDTTGGSLQTDLYLRIKPPTDTTRHERYYMHNVVVYPSYNLDKEIAPKLQDTIQYEELRIIQQQAFVKPQTLERAIAQDKGDLYAKKLQDQTINHLLDLGIFKFVNLKYQIIEQNDTNYLQRIINLTPSLTQDVTAELEASTEATDFLGSALSGSYVHRNLFRGAERLDTRLSVGMQTQLNRRNTSIPFINTLEFSAQASLSFPRFLVPFRLPEVSAYYVPKTKISISNNFQRRTNFFTINSFQTEFGYEWQMTRYQRHSFTPLNINLVQLLNTSNEFDTILNNNPRLRQSFSNTAILGLQYEFRYTDQEINTFKNYLFFRGAVESSGNLASALASTGQNGESGKFLGTRFSQFIRFDTETRYNILNKGNSLVGRLVIGVGIPYHNSSVMPYIKQFFVGGANSIRAFPIRGLGPGSVPPDTTARASFFDQTGDMKIEANLEYRFDVFSFLEGAVFADAGNIWQLRNVDQDQTPPEAEFDFNNFHKQLAVGTGVGIRFDFSFLLLRLDIAFPLRKPFLPPSNRWLFDELKPLSGKWRRDNLVYNIAIGYPF